MIATLHIKNIGIIEDLSINFNEGLNVLTGETGSGKSLIIDSLNIISGGRFSKEMIRYGKTYSLVEACIYLPNSEYAQDGNIIVSREIHTSGKNLCKINDRLVTVSKLKSFMQQVIDIHGQTDNQNIMQVENHLKYLDSYIGDKISTIKSDYYNLYCKYQDIKRELSKNYGDDIEKKRTLDLLYYQLNEINEANIKIGEEEELEEKRRIFQNSEKILQNLVEADNILSNEVMGGFDNVLRNLCKIEGYNKNYSDKLSSLQNMYYELQDICFDISAYKDEIDFDEDDIDKVEKRLELIYSLKRKYGNTIEEILNYKENVEKQIQTIENMEEYILSLKQKLRIIKDEMYNLAIKLNECRRKYAKSLEEKVNFELKDLEMPNATFKVEINFDNNENYLYNGLDMVQFIISTNVGEEYKPLIKIASGGELSRIMLAIKTVLSEVDNVSIMVFDEIDTGISGAAANAVSEKLRKISKFHQVLCVTHLPVIAASADHNYLISKKVTDGKTYSTITMLKDKEIISEIARISTGKITSIALKHALELKNSIR